MALTLSMSIEDIKKKIKDEVPFQVLADLNGLDIDTFKNVLRQYEKDTGEKLMPERKRGRPRTDNPGRSTQYRRAKEAREAEKNTEPDFGKLAVIAEMQHIIENLEEEVEKLEQSLKYERLALEAWRKLKEDYDK